jgi:uncharacterized protein (DUF58 family)
MEAFLDTCDHLDERQFQIAVKRLADSLSYGTDASPFLGSGIEYVQSRLYQSGDPIKSIDWRVTARSGKLHVKEYEAPKRMPVYLLVDTSASMCVTSQPLSKYGWAVQLAGGLALAALSRVSPVSLVGCGEREFKSQPSLSRSLVFQWLLKLRRYRLDEKTTLSRRIRQLASLLESRALLFVLSDFHDPDAASALKLAAQAHDCVALHLHDPAERGALRAGLFRGQEAETGEAFTGHGRSRWLDVEATAGAFKSAGIDYVRLPIDEPFIPKLRGYLRKRDCLGRGQR